MSERVPQPELSWSGDVLKLPENQWEKQIRSAAADMGWVSYHTYNAMRSDEGYPDLTMFHRRYGQLWLENKKEKGTVSANQLHFLGIIRESGGRAFVARPRNRQALGLIIQGFTDEEVRERYPEQLSEMIDEATPEWLRQKIERGW